MNNLLPAISIGISFFPAIAVLLALPMFLYQVAQKKINVAKLGLNFVFLFYMVCMISLVIFPLPDAAQAAQLSTHTIIWNPLHFISDIMRESSLDIHDVHTYLPELFNKGVWQLIFNVVMTIPFGMFLTYSFKYSKKKVVISTFLLSLLFEITQLTGLFFIYAGSYRFCDVDDLITNTLGGLLGYVLVKKCSPFLPELEQFDQQIFGRAQAKLNVPVH